jgi:hypothetical protein
MIYFVRKNFDEPNAKVRHAIEQWSAEYLGLRASFSAFRALSEKLKI